jgi:hypothetical protein
MDSLQNLWIGVLHRIVGVAAFFKQIWADNANFHNFMVKINTFLGRVVAFFAESWIWQNHGVMQNFV